jgi:hypothetical protein
MMDDRSQFRAALDTIQRDNPLIELRPVFPDGRYWQGIFDDRERLLDALVAMNRIEAHAVYWTFNRLRSDLTVTNKLAPVRKGGCVKNADVVRVRQIFLDYDGDRDAARELADNVQAHLAAKGWEAPILVSSGGGWYHFYPVDFDLKARFDNDRAQIDAKCVNPGRIARVPGSYHRKDTPVMARIVGWRHD